MTMKPLVSVIIPTYNRAEFLKSAIGSVLSQTYQNFEVIVIDDGSTDGTREIITSFSQDKIKYVYKSNGGQSSARNEGIRLAKGEYIAFLDSDDLWDPRKLEKQLACFQKDPSFGMVFTNYRSIDKDGKVLKEFQAEPGYVLSGNFIKDLLEIRFPSVPSSMMVKREAFEKVGYFNENLRISEDLDVWVRIGLSFGVGYINEVLTSVRLHEDHLMRQTPRDQIWINSVHVLESYEKEIAKAGLKARPYYAVFYLLAGDSALRIGKRCKAFGYYCQCVFRRPSFLRAYKRLMLCALPLSCSVAPNDGTDSVLRHYH